MLQYKSTSLAVKDVDLTKGRVLLYASAFGNIDSDGDIIEKGAFKKTIAEWGPDGKNRIKHLWQHNGLNPIGRPITLTEDDNGLLVDSYVTDAKNGDYRKLYSEGIITEHSVGFDVPAGKIENTGNNQIIKEARLWEYSAVTWGANDQTPVVAMKSMEKLEKINYLHGRMEKLYKFLRNSDATDETMQTIELELKQVHSLIDSLIKNEPIIKSPNQDEPNKNIAEWFDTKCKF